MVKKIHSINSLDDMIQYSLLLFADFKIARRPLLSRIPPNVSPSTGDIIQAVAGNIIPNSPWYPSVQKMFIVFGIGRVLLQRKCAILVLVVESLLKTKFNALHIICVISCSAIGLIHADQIQFPDTGHQISRGLVLGSDYFERVASENTYDRMVWTWDVQTRLERDS